MQSTVAALRQAVSYTCHPRLDAHLPRRVLSGHLRQLRRSSAVDVAQYDSELRAIADRLVPAREVNSRVRPYSPWFDAECRATRRQRRRLDRRYRRTRIDADRVAFCDAVRSKHAAFAATQNAYWTGRIAAERGNARKLWRSLMMTHQHRPPPLLLLTTSSTFLTRR